MPMPAGKWKSFAKSSWPGGRRPVLLFATTALLFTGCAREARVRIGDDIRMGAFTLRVTSVDSYSREHQGVPWEVAIALECSGGNRFERLDFTEALSRRGRIHFSTAENFRERAWLIKKGDDVTEFYIHVNPPQKSTGMTLEFSNAWPKSGEPRRIVVDLGS
jgi:hypothetical protein